MPPPASLVDALSSVVETGDERAVYYETTDEYVVVVRGREFILHAARGIPGRPDVELDTSVYGVPEDLPLRSP